MSVYTLVVYALFFGICWFVVTRLRRRPAQARGDGYDVEFPVEHVWEAVLRAVPHLGYTVTHTDRDVRTLSFKTGPSLWTWAGQDMTVMLFRGASDAITRMTITGTMGRGMHVQLFSYGERDRIARRFLMAVETVLDTLPPAQIVAASSLGPGDGARDSRSTSDRLAALLALLQSGTLTQAEYEAQRSAIIANL